MALILVVLVGTLARVVGSSFGLPLVLHPDEGVVVEGAIDMARRNSFEPPWSYRPDHVEMKIAYLVFAAYAALFKGLPTEVAFDLDPSTFYHLARLITAAFGVGTIVLAHLIGARWSRRLGVIAAALFAFFPPLVDHAHYATPDVPLTWAVMLLIYALMRYTDSPSRASLLCASLAVAVAVGIKYPGAIGAAMIALVVCLAAVRDRVPSRILTHGVASAAATVGFLFVISPVLFTNLSGVRDELSRQAVGGRLGNPDRGFLGSMGYYATTYAEASGIVLALVALLGAVIVIAQRRLDAVPWLTGLVFWVALSSFPFAWERWGLPMWVTPLLLGAVGLDHLWSRFTSSRARLLPVLVTAVVVLHLAVSSLTRLTVLLGEETRQTALAYARERGIHPGNTISEGYSPFLPGIPRSFFDQVEQTETGYLLRTAKGDPARYAVLSSFIYDRVLQDPAYENDTGVYRWIFNEGREVARFDPMTFAEPTMFEVLAISRNLQTMGKLVNGEMSGPTIRIFELPSTGARTGAHGSAAR